MRTWLGYCGFGSDVKFHSSFLFLFSFFFLRISIVTHNDSAVMINAYLEKLIQNISVCNSIDFVHFVRALNAQAHYLNPFISYKIFMVCKPNLRKSILIYSVDFSVKDLVKIFLSKVHLKKKRRKKNVYLHIGFFFLIIRSHSR